MPWARMFAGKELQDVVGQVDLAYRGGHRIAARAVHGQGQLSLCHWSFAELRQKKPTRHECRWALHSQIIDSTRLAQPPEPHQFSPLLTDNSTASLRGIASPGREASFTERRPFVGVKAWDASY
jgi:hypothetical protein